MAKKNIFYNYTEPRTKPVDDFVAAGQIKWSHRRSNKLYTNSNAFSKGISIIFFFASTSGIIKSLLLFLRNQPSRVISLVVVVLSQVLASSDGQYDSSAVQYLLWPFFQTPLRSFLFRTMTSVPHQNQILPRAVKGLCGGKRLDSARVFSPDNFIKASWCSSMGGDCCNLSPEWGFGISFFIKKTSPFINKESLISQQRSRSNGPQCQVPWLL